MGASAGTQVGEHYQIEEVLVEGPMGRLLRARVQGSSLQHLLLERPSPPSPLSGPERAGSDPGLERAPHPSVAPVVRRLSWGGFDYVAWEHIGGTPLSTYRSGFPEIVRSRAELWLNHLTEICEDFQALDPPLQVSPWSPELILVTGVGRLRVLALPAGAGSDRSGLSGQGAMEERAAEVERLARLGWWMLQGPRPEPGGGWGPLDPSELPDLTSAWLEALKECTDPARRSERPRTATELRARLLGEETYRAIRPPRMSWEVSELEFLRGPTGRMAHGRIRVRNTGGGELHGSVRTHERWIRVQPTSFQGNDAQIEFWVDPSGLAPAEAHRARILLKSQNEEVTLPLQLQTAAHWLSELPDSWAAAMPLLPGMAATLAVSLMFSSVHRSALSALEATTNLPLQGVSALPPEALIALPFSHPVVLNSKLAGLVASSTALAVPYAVSRLMSYYPEPQRARLVWLEVVAMLSPLLWLALLWNQPTFHHPALQNPSLSAIDLRANLLPYLILSLSAFAGLSQLTRPRLETLLPPPGKARLLSWGAATALSALLLLWMVLG